MRVFFGGVYQGYRRRLLNPWLFSGNPPGCWDSGSRGTQKLDSRNDAKVLTDCCCVVCVVVVADREAVAIAPSRFLLGCEVYRRRSRERRRCGRRRVGVGWWPGEGKPVREFLECR